MKTKITFCLLCGCLSLLAQKPDVSELIQHSNFSPETKDIMLYRMHKDINMSSFKLQESSLTDYRHDHVSRAPQDGCFLEIGDLENSYIKDGLSLDECATCEQNNGKLKTNESYVWGLTQGNDQVYFGVNANMLCIVIADMNRSGLAPKIPPYKNNCWACEYEKSPHKDSYGDLWGDWHAPSIYHYNPITKKTENVTPGNDVDMNKTYGLRAAGSLNNVSFIAGPNKDYRGLSFYAYDNVQNKFLGAFQLDQLPEFENCIPFNIRKSIVINNILYFGVEYTYVDPSDNTTKSEGAILRWYGNDQDLNNFKVVGWTKLGAAEFAVMKNKLYVGTWPISICRSEEIPEDGFQPITGMASEVGHFKTVFDYTNYEPDMIQKSITGCGGMATYKDQIYFGTLHMTWCNPFCNSVLYRIDPEKDPEGYISSLLGAYRVSELFRISEEEDPTKQNENQDIVSSYKTYDGCKIELLYGEEDLPAYDFASKQWNVTSTNWTPIFGEAGFGNKFNNYIWSAAVYNDRLFLGTMDYSNLVEPISEVVLQNIDNYEHKDIIMKIINTSLKDMSTSGYDLIYFDDPMQPAKIMNKDGLGTTSAYGIRNMISSDSRLFLGTANPLSLEEQGGWEIIEISNQEPYCETNLTWEPKSLIYGDTIGINQLNAKALCNELEIPGKFKYTYHWIEIPTDSIYTPQTMDLRVVFVPDDLTNYTIARAKRSITIEKAPLQVIAPNTVIEQGASFPTESYHLTYEGFVLNHDENILDIIPKWEVINLDINTPGNYTIHPSGGSSNLYEMSYTDGNLTVNPATILAKTSKDKIRIYPIPVKEQIFFEGNLVIQKVVISSVDGIPVISENLPGKSINVSQLNNAPYILTIYTEAGIITRTIIVNR